MKYHKCFNLFWFEPAHSSSQPLTIRLLSESVTRVSVGVCKLSLIDFSRTLLFVALYADSHQLQ